MGQGPGTDTADVWSQYRRALIRIAIGGRTLAVQLLGDEPLAPCSGPWPFEVPVVVLTAWNPGSRPRDDEANRAAQAALEAELRAAGHTLLPAEGVGTDTGWTELSVAVPGMELEAAVAAGVRHGQLALYRLDPVAAEVVACLDADRRERQPWRSRWEATPAAEVDPPGPGVRGEHPVPAETRGHLE